MKTGKNFVPSGGSAAGGDSTTEPQFGVTFTTNPRRTGVRRYIIMRPFKFFFFVALAFIFFFWVTKIVFIAFLIAGALTLAAFVFGGLARLFGFRRRRYHFRYRAEPLDSRRQPYTSEPIAPRFSQRFDTQGEQRIIEIQ